MARHSEVRLQSAVSRGANTFHRLLGSLVRLAQLKASLVQLSRKAKDCSVRLEQVTAVAADVSRVKRVKHSM